MALVLQDLDLNAESRKRLYGKVATFRDWIVEIQRLQNGDARRHQLPMNQSDIANLLGVSRFWIIQLLKLAKQNGLDKLTNQSKEDSAFLRLQKDGFANHPLIAEWIQDMRNRNNGEGIVGWHYRVGAVRTICNTLKIKPDQLIIDKQTTERLWLNFMDALKNNLVDRDREKNRKLKGIKSGRAYYIGALRSFCSKFGITWARKESETMNNKVVNHGQYAHIRLTDEEFELADKYIKENYGVDSDLYRIFWVGVESCGREKALFGMKCDWNVMQEGDETIFVMRAFESKTKQHNGGWWDKFITRPDTIESLKMHKKHNNVFIWSQENTKSSDVRAGEISEELRKLYHAIGKIPNLHELYQDRKDGKPPTDNYFFEKPLHSLRHIGAHYWLAKTNYDYGIVAEVGGWMTIDELKKSYGAMPPEIKYRKIKEAAKKK